MKQCIKCSENKEEIDFSIGHKKRSNVCYPCKRKYNVCYYATHRKKTKERIYKGVKQRRQLNIIKKRQYLQEHPCVSCGENNHIVLEFDHLRDKYKNIGDMIGSYSWLNIKKEIDKCQVLCANCHRIVTHERRQKAV